MYNEVKMSVNTELETLIDRLDELLLLYRAMSQKSMNSISMLANPTLMHALN